MGLMLNIFGRNSKAAVGFDLCVKFFGRSVHYYEMPKSRVSMPESRVLYTVLRSPHIDKKSREQFAMKIKKDYFVMKAEKHEMYKKLFWLKRQRLLGALNYELVITSKSTLPRRLLSNPKEDDGDTP